MWHYRRGNNEKEEVDFCVNKLGTGDGAEERRGDFLWN